MAYRIQRWDSQTQQFTVYPKNYQQPRLAFRDLGDKAALEMFTLAESEGRDSGKIKYWITDTYVWVRISFDEQLQITYETIDVG